MVEGKLLTGHRMRQAMQSPQVAAYHRSATMSPFEILCGYAIIPQHCFRCEDQAGHLVDRLDFGCTEPDGSCGVGISSNDAHEHSPCVGHDQDRHRTGLSAGWCGASATEGTRPSVVQPRCNGAPSEVDFTVVNLGVGFDPEHGAKRKGLGLISMRERVRLVNGMVTIESKPMGGTTIRIRVPFRLGNDAGSGQVKTR